MQVNAVTNSVNQQANMSFGLSRESAREQLGRFADLDDRTLRTIAYKQAGIQVNDKKHKRISNAMILSLPLAGGLKAALNPEIVGRIPRIKAFASSAGLWGGALAGLGVLGAIDNYLYKHSETKRKFEKNHPILSTLTNLAIGIGVVTGTSFGLMAAKGKFGTKIIEQLKKAKVDKFITESKALNMIQSGISKVPSAIKEVGKFIADISPLAIVITDIAHSYNHSKVKNMVANENYCDLKLKQVAAKQAIAIADAEEA